MRTANVYVTGPYRLILAWLVLFCVGCGAKQGRVFGTRPICDVSHGQTIVTAAEALIRQNHYPAVDCRTLLINAREAMGRELQIDSLLPDAQVCDPARFYGDVLAKNPDAACDRVAWDMVAGMVAGLDPYSKVIPPGVEKSTPVSNLPESTLVMAVLPSGIRYVRIAEFKSSMAADLWTHLSTGGNAGLIIDLRDSRGGSLEEGLACANLFVTEGVLAILRGRHERSNRTVHTRPLSKKISKISLALLINGKTASAAEAFAAALQANGRAAVVGQRSYGKGSVQANIPLQNGARLRLTIAHIYTPDGQPIQGHGILPDVPVTDSPWTNMRGLPRNRSAIAKDPTVKKAVRLLTQTS